MVLSSLHVYVCVCGGEGHYWILFIFLFFYLIADSETAPFWHLVNVMLDVLMPHKYVQHQ